MKGNNVIYFSSDEWDSGLKTSQYHIAIRLSRENKVLYINSIGLRKPKASRSDLTRIINKLKKYLKGAQRINSNLFVFTPIVIPFHGIKCIDAINTILLTLFIRYYQVKLKLYKPYLLTFLPNIVDILGRFGERKIIYYCADEITSFRGVATEKIEEMESRLLEKADHVIVTSKQLYEHKRRFKPTVLYLPHGVDVKLFNKALKAETEVPLDIKKLKKPIIGFWGHISNDWLDFGLIRSLALRYPEWTILLIGKVDADIPDLSEYKNVVILGPRDYQMLPNYAKAFSVAIIPFIDSTLTRNSNPLKLKEYLAAGCPVVSTPIPEVMSYANVIKIAYNKEEFTKAIEDYINNDSEENRIARSRCMEKEDWEYKFENFIKEIES
ncbi:MAG: glycosyltransferase [Candidatus Omnitrophica bacterium]|nr:glycosyltransferase [Candidatus Omnitrophota bacterium]